MQTAREIKKMIQDLEETLARFKDRLQLNQAVLLKAKTLPNSNLFDDSFQEIKNQQEKIDQYKEKRKQESLSLSGEAFQAWDNSNFDLILNSVKTGLARLQKTLDQTLENAANAASKENEGKTEKESSVASSSGTPASKINDSAEKKAKLEGELKSEFDSIFARIDAVENEILKYQKKVMEHQAAVERLNKELYQEKLHAFDDLQGLIQKMKSEISIFQSDIAQGKLREAHLPTYRLAIEQIKEAAASIEAGFVRSKPIADQELDLIISEVEGLQKFLQSSPSYGECLDELDAELRQLATQTGLSVEKVLELGARARQEEQGMGRDAALLLSQYAIQLAYGGQQAAASPARQQPRSQQANSAGNQQPKRGAPHPKKEGKKGP